MKYLIIFLLFLNFSNAQTYEFINSEIQSKDSTEKIFLMDSFLNLKEKLNDKPLNLETIKLWWNLKNDTPPVELFIKNFSIEHINLELDHKSKNTKIDFSLLNKSYVEVNEEYQKLNPNKTYLSLSQPIFNCSQDWCIIVESTFRPYTGTASGGMMSIYVKINNEWYRYHSINLWLD